MENGLREGRWDDKTVVETVVAQMRTHGQFEGEQRKLEKYITWGKTDGIYINMERGVWQARVRGVANSWTQGSN